MPLAPVKSLLHNTSSQVRTLPLLMIGMSTLSTRAFTTERSAAPCRRRRADEWRACRARKAAPDAWRLLASVSVDDTGLQRRNLAETVMLRERDRDETIQQDINAQTISHPTRKGLTDALNERPIFLSEQVCSEMFLSGDILRTSEV
jgi:hypothetical protein